MAKIIWNDNLSVKVQEFDAQHRKLIGLVNDLGEAMTVGKGKDVLGKVLNELIQYTQIHFAAEERLMTTHAYPGLKDHLIEHQKLTQKALEIQKSFQTSRVGLTIPVMTFLNQWLTQHILHTDKQYSDFFISKGVR